MVAVFYPVLDMTKNADLREGTNDKSKNNPISTFAIFKLFVSYGSVTRQHEAQSRLKYTMLTPDSN